MVEEDYSARRAVVNMKVSPGFQVVKVIVELLFLDISYC